MAPKPKNIPPGEWLVTAYDQVVDGHIYRLFGSPDGQAEVEDSRMLFRADEIEFDRETGDLHARGHVYYYSFERKETILATRVDYNTETRTGKFYNPVGEMQPSITVRRGVLMSSNPFHFEGEWAERMGDKFVVYNGWVTNCRLPNPWWVLRGPKFDIVPGDRAIAHRSRFVLHKVPVFYMPFFYHSLAEEPRKSGFLMPSIGNSSRRGMMYGIGYFWAINRWSDATYRIQNFTARGFTHHLDFRAKPNAKTDFGAVLYGVQDRGAPNSGDPPVKYSGFSLYAVGRSDLGNGWKAQGTINYITSFRFRQQWTESFNEAIGSEIHSIGFIGKNWQNYTFNIVGSRLENFLSEETRIEDPVTKEISYQSNAVTIRKLPEAQFSGADRRIGKLPLWFSFQSAAGLLYRASPVFEDGKQVEPFQTGRFMNRVNLAPHITSALHLGDFHLVPSLGIRETYYGEGQALEQGHYRVRGTNLVRSARDFSLDLVFPTLTRIFDKKTVFGDKLKHVIEPRATYRYVTGIGKDFDRFIRFDETDLLSDTNELELSLTNRIFAKRGNSVREVFTWQLSQKRFFDPTFGGALIEGQRNIFESTAGLSAYSFLLGPRSTSPIVSTLRMSPVDGLGILWQADYDPRRKAIIDSAFAVDYRWKNYYYFSAGHNQVHIDPVLTPPANQFRFQGGFGDANRRGWNVGAVTVYDWRKGVFQYSTAQVTYNTDCCGISVQYRQWNAGIRDTRNEWRVSFSVANIGSFGTLRKQDRIF